MMRPSPRQLNPDSNLFMTPESSVASTRFWMQLVRYRPLILVGGLWLGLICAAAIAYGRLMSAGVPPESRQAPPPVTVPPAPGSNGALMGPMLPATPTATAPTPVVQPTMDSSVVTSDAMTGQEPFPVGALGLLVGGCAAGCFVLSRQASAPPKPRQERPQKPLQGENSRRSQRPASRRKDMQNKPPSRPLAPAPKRLERYSPERDQLVVPSRASGAPTAPRAAATPRKVSQPSQRSSAPPTEPTPEVTLMPQDEAHPLDWAEDSIAHSLDIRQRRSLSSFL